MLWHDCPDEHPLAMGCLAKHVGSERFDHHLFKVPNHEVRKQFDGRHYLVLGMSFLLEGTNKRSQTRITIVGIDQVDETPLAELACDVELILDSDTSSFGAIHPYSLV